MYFPQAADGNCSYRIGSHVLSWSDETRDLGVIIDNKLSFNCRIIVKKLNSLKHLVRTTVAESHN